jgi:hypothetical protein
MSRPVWPRSRAPRSSASVIRAAMRESRTSRGARQRASRSPCPRGRQSRPRRSCAQSEAECCLHAKAPFDRDRRRLALRLLVAPGSISGLHALVLGPVPNFLALLMDLEVARAVEGEEQWQPLHDFGVGTQSITLADSNLAGRQSDEESFDRDDDLVVFELRRLSRFGI